VRWFGEGWGAPVNAEAERAPVPAGTTCAYSGCGEPITESDSGFLIPFVSDEADDDTAARLVVVAGEAWPHLAYHRDCMAEAVLGVGWRASFGAGT
jgi:hypothetical protein